MTAAQTIVEALERYRKANHFVGKPTRVFLGDYAYDMIHTEAKDSGIGAKKHPEYEDDRLEFRGMKVHCHHSASIAFE